jgi:HD-like signal output (HDOD) protein
MLYRLKQLFKALFAKVELHEYSWLESVLTPAELTLFCKQTLAEQRHALDVAIDILNHKAEIEKAYGTNVYQDLLLAALLHDCGKSLIKLHLWQRIIIATAGYLPNKLREKIANHNIFLNKTLVIYKQHPAWGKWLASKAKMNENIQKLILNHHTPSNQLEQLLYEADNRH